MSDDWDSLYVNIKQKYHKLEQRVLATRNGISTDHPQICQTIFDFLGFNQWLDDNYNIPLEDSSPQIKTIRNLYYHNTNYLHVSFITLERNMHFQSKALMRVIIESIFKMYYITSYPKNFQYIWLKDVFDYEAIIGSESSRRLNQSKSFTILQKTYPNEFNGTFDECLRKTNHCSLPNIIDQLYSSNRKKLLYKQWYQTLHIGAHASLIKHDQSYNCDTMSTALYDLCILAYYNIDAIMNGHNAEKQFPNEECNLFLSKMRTRLTTNDHFFDMTPDRKINEHI